MWMKYVMCNGFYWWEEGHNNEKNNCANKYYFHAISTIISLCDVKKYIKIDCK